MGRGKKTLPVFIDEIGVNKLAQILCLERSTIRKWRTGTQIPTAANMSVIVKLSKGSVSYTSIIEPWVKQNPNLNVLP